MAYDERLANRIRQAFGVRDDITERKMWWPPGDSL
jgi:hypothetical protein